LDIDLQVAVKKGLEEGSLLPAKISYDKIVLSDAA
jgi:hypothetical protein